MILDLVTLDSSHESGRMEEKGRKLEMRRGENGEKYERENGEKYEREWNVW